LTLSFSSDYLPKIEFISKNLGFSSVYLFGPPSSYQMLVQGQIFSAQAKDAEQASSADIELIAEKEVPACRVRPVVYETKDKTKNLQESLKIKGDYDLEFSSDASFPLITLRRSGISTESEVADEIQVECGFVEYVVLSPKKSLGLFSKPTLELSSIGLNQLRRKPAGSDVLGGTRFLLGHMQNIRGLKQSWSFGDSK
jgi:hypothetical protein